MSNEHDGRINTNATEARKPRAMEDRAVVENRELTDSERLNMFRMQNFQQVLPDLPKIPGYHCVWLSTSSKNDTIAHRERLGYTPITQADVPGWNFGDNSLKSGEIAGLISINEMVAYKIPQSLYEGYMRIAHYDRPNEQDGKLLDTVEDINAQLKDKKAYIETFDGVDEIRNGMRSGKPEFA